MLFSQGLTRGRPAECFVVLNCRANILFTLRESPPAYSEALPMRADGKWKEETHIVKQSGQGEEGEEGVEPSWRLS